MTGHGRHDHLFVYGTLKRASSHPMAALLRERARHVGHGTIQARLYVIVEPDMPDCRYPGALPSADPRDRVHGELYRVTDPDRLWPVLDGYEGCSPDWPEPHDFLPRSIEVTLDDGSRMWATAYLYTWDVTGQQHIASGRFEDYASASG